MIRLLRSLFAWRLVGTAGVWAYYENAVTGRRKAVRYIQGGWSPRDDEWLAGKYRLGRIAAGWLNPFREDGKS